MSMTVEDLSRRSGFPANTIRYYVRIGLLQPTRHPENGYRLFKESDLSRLGFIAKAKGLGFTLSEIAKLIHTSEQGGAPCRLARKILKRRVVENRGKIERFVTLQGAMERALAAWETLPDPESESDCICHLVENTFPASDLALCAESTGADRPSTP
jgi:DNA-binding transcriptional MerR regulator